MAIFKSKVLKLARKDIEEKTDLLFHFVEHKESRKVTHLEFFWSKNPAYEQQELPFQNPPWSISRSRLRHLHSIKNFRSRQMESPPDFKSLDLTTGGKSGIVSLTKTGRLLLPIWILRSSAKPGPASISPTRGDGCEVVYGSPGMVSRTIHQIFTKQTGRENRIRKNDQPEKRRKDGTPRR